MKLIGLTGGVGCGKSTVSQILAAQGYALVDADILAREVVIPGSPGFRALVQVFGPTIIHKGEINRERLRDEMLARPDQKSLLEKILHPLIQWRADREFRENRLHGTRVVIYDAALIFEKNLERKFQGVICVLSNEENQVKRIMKRNSVSEAIAKKMVEAQMPNDEKRKRATWVVDNDGTMEELKTRVKEVIRELEAPGPTQ